MSWAQSSAEGGGAPPRRLDVPAFTSLDTCLCESRPDFVLTATPRAVTPRFIAEAVDKGLPVLAETPPAPDLAGLRALWSAVGDSGLVQVAEQYPMMPSHCRPGGAGCIRCHRYADPGAGLFHPAVPRCCTDPPSARRRPRAGFGPGHPVRRAAGQSVEPNGLDRRRGGAPYDHDDRDTRLRGRTLRGCTTSPSSRRATSCGSGGSQCGDRRGELHNDEVIRMTVPARSSAPLWCDGRLGTTST